MGNCLAELAACFFRFFFFLNFILTLFIKTKIFGKQFFGMKKILQEGQFQIFHTLLRIHPILTGNNFVKHENLSFFFKYDSDKRKKHFL